MKSFMNLESYTIIWVDDSTKEGKKQYAKLVADPQYEQWFVSQGE